MAVVEQLQPLDAPVVSIKLTLKEARGLVTLLGSGTDDEARRQLDLDSLLAALKMYYPEYRIAGFGWCAELDHIEKD